MMRIHSLAASTRGAALVAALAALAVAAAGPDRAHAGPATQPVTEQTLAGVRFVERFPHGGTSASPLVVALHGRGDSPDRMARLFDDFPATAEIALAQAPLAFGSGSQWFDWRPDTTSDQLGDAVAAAETALWPAIAALAQRRKVVVVGFSQGAVMAFAIAARHPDAVSYAFPIAGLLPGKLAPSRKARPAPVYALHGDADSVVPVTAAHSTVAAFQAAGGTAAIHEIPGIGHTITPAMRDELFARIQAVVAASAPATPTRPAARPAGSASH
jgi:phospholipase/carboxylesterase